jgi:divalent metal cation (Fe/Co/Zn/Cd) transporter
LSADFDRDRRRKKQILNTAESTSTTSIPSDRNERLARLVSWFTVAWNSTEAVVALTAAAMAGSPALLGFGLDSIVESLSSLVMIWRFHHLDRGRHREQRALQLVGGSLLLLAGFVTFDAIRSLVYREHPESSYVGIGLAVVSIVVMPVLARYKRHIARQIGSHALHADSKQTDICWYLATILLIGIGLNAAFGWWWADPAAALLMVPLIAKEGFDALRGKACCGDVH